MADIIEVDNSPDDEILDAIGAFFDNLRYLEESQSKRYMATRYYSKPGDTKALFGSARYGAKLGGFSSIGISDTGKVFDRSGTGVQYTDTVRL